MSESPTPLDPITARKVDAEARAQTALAEKYQAEASLARATLVEAQAKADRARLDAEYHAMTLERERIVHQTLLAGDVYHHIYHFTRAVDDNSVERAMSTLTAWSRTDPGCDIEVVFNSPGGSVVDGMALYDFLQTLRRKGHQVTTVALGMAASMAGILVQAGDVRVMGKESYLMIHEASFLAAGKIGEVEDTVEWVKMVCERILDIFADRAAGSAAAKPITRAQIKTRWTRKDWWVSSDEALRLGLVDEVR